MKKPSLILLFVAAVGLTANAATITWNATLSKNGFDLANGNDLPAGSLVRVGTFSIADAVIAANSSNVSFLNSNFTEAATTTIGSGVGGAAGHFSLTSSNYANAVTLAGKQIYYWAFSSTDNTSPTTSINTATQIGIFYEPMTGGNPAWAFPTDASLGSTTVSLSNLTDAATSTTKLAEAKTIVGTFGPGTSATSTKPNFTLQSVPEPTSVSLLIFGGLAMAASRRRRLA